MGCTGSIAQGFGFQVAESILAGRESPVPGELGRRDMVVIEGVYKSAAAGSKRMELKYAVR